MGQNVEWKKTSNVTKGRIVRTIKWKKHKMEKTPDGTKRRMGQNVE
jgi:hypothetical protein